MPWNWEISGWPKFNFDPAPLIEKERQFHLGIGNASAFLKNTKEQEYSLQELQQLVIWPI